MFQQSNCIHSLMFIVWPKPHSTCHPLLSCSKHCLCDVHVCIALKMPMSILLTSLNIAYIISNVNTEFLDSFLDGLQASGTTFQDSLATRALLISWPYLCETRTLCTDHPFSNCSENRPRSSCHHLLSKYANRTSLFSVQEKLVSLSRRA
jgi:hypothetical protein